MPNDNNVEMLTEHLQESVKLLRILTGAPNLSEEDKNEITQRVIDAVGGSIALTPEQQLAVDSGITADILNDLLNSTPELELTPAQWDAVNSGITAIAFQEVKDQLLEMFKPNQTQQASIDSGITEAIVKELSEGITKLFFPTDPQISAMNSGITAAILEELQTGGISFDDLIGELGINKGGTGATDVITARTNLEVPSVSDLNSHVDDQNNPHEITLDVLMQPVGGILPMSMGGTGVTELEQFISLLNITASSIGAASQNHSHILAELEGEIGQDRINGIITVNKGGTGGSNTTEAIINLGITPSAIAAADKDHKHAIGDVLNSHVENEETIYEPIPINMGGTGGTTTNEARNALRIYPQNIGAAEMVMGYFCYNGGPDIGSVKVAAVAAGDDIIFNFQIDSIYNYVGGNWVISTDSVFETLGKNPGTLLFDLLTQKIFLILRGNLLVTVDITAVP